MKLRYKNNLNYKERLLKIMILLIFLSIPSVFAQPQIANQMGLTIMSWMQNVYVVYAFALIFYFMILYSVFSAAAKYVKIFVTEDNNINKNGKVFALTAAGISTLSLFALGHGSITSLLKNLLDPWGILGGLLIAAIVFMLLYFGLGKSQTGEKEWELATLLAGVAMVYAGMISSYPNIMWWGWLIFLIGLIFFIVRAFRKSESKVREKESTQPELFREKERIPESPKKSKVGGEKKEDKTKDKKEKGEGGDEKEVTTPEKEEESSSPEESTAEKKETQEEKEWLPKIIRVDLKKKELIGKIEEK